MADVLGQRALDRALLERRLLLPHADLPVLDAVEHLVGLQAQAPLPPYLALWSRRSASTHTRLGRLLVDRAVVRLSLMRHTVHLVSVRDALALRPLVQVVIERGHHGAYGRRTGGADPARLATEVTALLAVRPMTARELSANRRAGARPPLIGRDRLRCRHGRDLDPGQRARAPVHARARGVPRRGARVGRA